MAPEPEHGATKLPNVGAPRTPSRRRRSKTAPAAGRSTDDERVRFTVRSRSELGTMTIIILPFPRDSGIWCRAQQPFWHRFRYAYFTNSKPPGATARPSRYSSQAAGPPSSQTDALPTVKPHGMGGYFGFASRHTRAS